jgi:four helix bundle protein
LNVAEGNRRSGKDRLHHFRIAAGSAEEVRTALRVAAAWGDLQEPAMAEPLRLLDRVLGMLWSLSRSTPRARSVDG